MRAKEFTDEDVNPQVFKRGFQKTKQFKQFTLVAKHGDLPYIPGKKAAASDQFHVEAYDGKLKVAWVNFQVINNNLEAIDVVVDEDYRRGGIATAMYKFAQELGNTVQPSDKQTDAGKAFWQGNKMRADEFVSEDIEGIYESVDDELHELVKQHVSMPISNLTHNVALKLKAWALEVLHSLNKGADSEKVSMRTLKAIINDPERFAAQLITHEVSRKAQQ